MLNGCVASAPAHAGPPHSVSFFVYISVVFIYFPREGGDTGRKCDMGVVAGRGDMGHVGHDSSPPGRRRRGGAEVSPPSPPSVDNVPSIRSSQHLGQSFQMLMSLTSVGVQDRSTSSSTRLVSVELLCC